MGEESVDQMSQPADENPGATRDESAQPTTEDAVTVSSAPPLSPTSPASVAPNTQATPTALPQAAQPLASPAQPYPYPPAYPSGPYAMPPSGWYPPYPGMSPAQPGPSYPSYPNYPGYFAQPGVPIAMPALPGPTEATLAHSQPLYPPSGYLQQGYSQAGYPQPAYGLSIPPDTNGTVSRKPHHSPFARFARAISRRLRLELCLGAVVVLLFAYVAEVIFAGTDWAQGALAASTATIALGGAVLVLLLLRLVGGWRVASSIVLSLVIVIVLAGSGTAGVFLSPNLHRVQALYEEQNGQWALALREFGLAGDSGSNATDLARVNVEWAEQLLRNRSYGEAAKRLELVVNNYRDTGSILNRAYDDLFTTYMNWVRSGASDIPYQDAITFFDSYRTVPQCDASCAGHVNDIEAQTYYQYGVQLVNQGQYGKAAAAFEAVQTRFPRSPYVHQAHSAAAPAYYADAQQNVSNNCSVAEYDYETLATEYSDTPDGQKAKHVLTEPVSVSGTLTNFPTDPLPTVYLSKNAHAPDSTNAPAGSFYFSDDYAARVNPNTGDFTFANVKPGNYALSAEITYSGGGDNVSWWFWGVNASLFGQISPVCANNIGSFNDHLQQ